MSYSQTNVLLAIAALTIGFLCYHFLSQSQALRLLFEKKLGEAQSKIHWVYFQRMLGVFFYGLMPLVLVFVQDIDLQDVGISLRALPTSLAWIAGLGVVVTVMNYFAARSAGNLAVYPQIRVSPPWGRGLLLGSALTWAAYLLAYEFLFRGYLLFTCTEEMGRWLAIALNVSLYALVHVPKGWKETVGAIPLGIVLCLLTLRTGTIWIAFGVHVVMAWGNEWWSLWWQGRRGA